ncbi:hypothetical protein ACFLWG_04775, partial [Chloroflexota bacterium]
TARIWVLPRFLTDSAIPCITAILLFPKIVYEFAFATTTPPWSFLPLTKSAGSFKTEFRTVEIITREVQGDEVAMVKLGRILVTGYHSQ